MRLWLLEHKFSEERFLELTKFSGQLTYKSLKILDPVINKSKGFFSVDIDGNIIFLV